MDDILIPFPLLHPAVFLVFLCNNDYNHFELIIMGNYILLHFFYDADNDQILSSQCFATVMQAEAQQDRSLSLVAL